MAAAVQGMDESVVRLYFLRLELDRSPWLTSRSSACRPTAPTFSGLLVRLSHLCFIALEVGT